MKNLFKLNFKFKKVFFQWILSYLLIIIIPISGVIICYNIARQSSAAEIYSDVSNELNKLIFSLDNIIMTNNLLIVDITKNEFFEDIFYDTVSSPAELDTCLIRLHRDLRQMLSRNSNISALTVYINKLDIIISSNGMQATSEYFNDNYTGSDVTYEDWYRQINSNNYFDYLLTNYRSSETIDFFYQLPAYSSSIVEATLIITYGRETLGDSQYFLSKGNSENMTINLIDQNGTHILGTDFSFSLDHMPKLSGSERFDGNTYIYTTSTSTNWKYYAKVADELYTEKLFSLYVTNLIVLIICSLLSYVISMYIGLKTYKPLNTLTDMVSDLIEVDDNSDEYSVIRQFIDNYKGQHNYLRSLKYSNFQMKQMNFIEKQILNYNHNTIDAADLNINFISDIFAIIIFKVINPENLFFKNKATEDENSYDTILFIIKNVCSELIELSGNKLFITNINGNIVGLINFSEDAKAHTSDIILNEIKQALYKAQKFIKENFGFSFSSYISESCTGSENIHKIYSSAETTFKSRIAYFENEIIYTDIINDTESTANDKNNGNLIDEVIVYISENFHDENINVSTISQKFGLTPYYVSSIFKRTTGIRLVDYIARLRLEKAKELLINSQDNIETIAISVGFGNAKTFTRTFIKFEGTTPGKYRNHSSDESEE